MTLKEAWGKRKMYRAIGISHSEDCCSWSRLVSRNATELQILEALREHSGGIDPDEIIVVKGEIVNVLDRRLIEQNA